MKIKRSPTALAMHLRHGGKSTTMKDRRAPRGGATREDMYEGWEDDFQDVTFKDDPQWSEVT